MKPNQFGGFTFEGPDEIDVVVSVAAEFHPQAYVDEFRDQIRHPLGFSDPTREHRQMLVLGEAASDVMLDYIEQAHANNTLPSEQRSAAADILIAGGRRSKSVGYVLRRTIRTVASYLANGE